MSNVFSKVTAALLAVLLLYFFPMMQTAKRQDDVVLLTTYRQVENFVDSVRNKGYITPVMYNEFTANVGSVLSGYDIQMKHRQKRIQPEYEDPADSTTFLGTYSVHYDEYYQDVILAVLFPDNPNDGREEPKYFLSAGDFFDVELDPKENSASSVFSRLLYPDDSSAARSPLNYGGMVFNEDY